MESVWRRGGRFRLARAVAPVAALAALAMSASAGAASGPPLAEPASALRAALRCDAAARSGDAQPVLLVHGTGSRGSESWGWNYSLSLPPLGFGVCTVDLPGRSMVDIQRSSEYVVHAIRVIHRSSGRKVDVIGHSQGTLQPRWAIRWWPDVRRDVADYVSLAGPHHGVSVANAACIAGRCAPAIWQMRQGSDFLAALNSGDETPGRISYTSIYSTTDELVEPSRTAVLDGASNASIQSLCPVRYVHHMGVAEDAVAFDLTIDALTHRGPADPARTDPSACDLLLMPGVGDFVKGNATVYGTGVLALATTPMVSSEPDLRSYATR